MGANERIYSAAYIMPSGKSRFGYEKKHQNNLKHLYEIAGGYYPAPVGYMDEIWINGHGYVQNAKPYYKRWYRGKRSKYFKQQSNRKIRRYNGELHKGNMAYKLYDFWWELC